MSSTGQAVSAHPSQLRFSQTALMATRNAAKVIARKLGANVNYDLHLYEAIKGLRRWSPQDVVFDVGANDGRTIFRLMRHLPAPREFLAIARSRRRRERKMRVHPRNR